MNFSLKDLAGRLNGAGNKTKKYVDRLYLFALFLFVAAQACCLTKNVGQHVFIILDISSLILILIGIYRIIFELCTNWKKALLLIAVVLFGYIYTLNRDEAMLFSPVAFAIIGAAGVNADYVLFSGLTGNIVMIVTNIIVTITQAPGLFINRFQDRDFFYLGGNVFYVSKWNNFSCTDMAAHYFWIIAVYLWVRAKKITWGEICALGALGILVYSLTGSNTSFVCIGLLLLLAVVMKVRILAGRKNAPSKASVILRKIFSFCARYSYLIFAVFCILMAVIYNSADPLINKINNTLNQRFSLGHRGIIEHGIHLIASDVPSYGMASSADEFYNFLDCSYISVLINSGVLLLVFYLLSMTAIQIRHKKFLYGLGILAVCALSCIEEHHLPELPYNLFVLLLFADIAPEKKISAISEKKASRAKMLSIASFFVCLAFVVSAVFINIPRFKAVKELDRLDSKASSIYAAVQNNMNAMKENGTWQKETADMSSYQYGEVLAEPEDYMLLTGARWKDEIKDPKAHSYFSITLRVTDNEADGISTLLINDEVMGLIGDGSCVIEYDVSAGKVYSVWFSESSDCRAIKGGRASNRAERLKDGVVPTGYYAGVINV